MPLPFQPPSPPCVRCGTTTAMAPVVEAQQRVFVVRCPACRHSHTYSLDYDILHAQ
jgi:transcription elongation factor Elf1